MTRSMIDVPKGHTLVTMLRGDVRAAHEYLIQAGVRPGLVCSSPPFLALRSYLPEGHPDKVNEIGSEPTPAAFLDTMLGLTADWRRLIPEWGSIAVEIGDTYSGSGSPGGDYNPGGMRDGQPRTTYSGARDKSGWPLAKSLCGIPTLYTWSLAYARNLLTGAESPAGAWRVRNLLTWTRPNPPVGCVDDQTEAPTPDGWKRHDELADGDLIAAYDPTTDSCRFQPAKFVRWHRENETMIAIDKRKTSQRLTFDHRCLVRTAKRPEPFVVLAGNLRNDQQMLLSARLEEVPGQEPITDARAELLGWYIAEGSTHHNQALIRQSLTANRPKVDRIRDLLIADGADFTESSYQTTSGTYGGSVLVTFHVKGELAEWLNLHHKRLPMQYVTTWPTRTVRALWMGLIDGDGHRRRNGGTLLFQKERPVCDAVQVIAIRLGLRATVTRQESMDGWQVTIGDQEHHESSRWTKVRKWDQTGIPTEQYTGVVWCPMVESSFWLARRNGRTFVTGNSLGDKFRPATSYVTVACTGGKRWFDLDAVRTPVQHPNQTATRNGKTATDDELVSGRRLNDYHAGLSAGAPPLDWWDSNDLDDDQLAEYWQPLHRLPTSPYKGSHYAAFPVALPQRLIEAMCPASVCSVCGEPRRRMTVTTNTLTAVADRHDEDERRANATETNTWKQLTGATCSDRATLGWTDCGHDAYAPGVVLDPFGGSGTTAVAAANVGRDCILIDLDERNVELVDQRLRTAQDVTHYEQRNNTHIWIIKTPDEPRPSGWKRKEPKKKATKETNHVDQQG